MRHAAHGAGDVGADDELGRDELEQQFVELEQQFVELEQHQHQLDGREPDSGIAHADMTPDKFLARLCTLALTG